MSVTPFGGFYNLIKIKCFWRPFVDLMLSSKEVQNATTDRNGVLNLYEIEFKDQKILLSQEHDPSRVVARLFDGIRIKKLIMHDLSLKQIDGNAFDDCCRQSLQHLDLSLNKLKRVNFAKNLKNLRYLDLESNQLQLKDENFANNLYLTEINLSNNQLQHVPEKLFANLYKLERVHMKSNQIDELSACVFYPLQKEKATNVKISLLNNSIKCNCDVFYVKRKLGLSLDLVCGSNEPAYYVGKHLASLDAERPDKILCNDYKTIKKRCAFVYDFGVDDLDRYYAYKYVTIVFSVLLAVALLTVYVLTKRLPNSENAPNSSENSKYGRLSQNDQ